MELQHVHFSLPGCIISMLCIMENGSSAGITVSGKEDMVGIALFMDGDSTTSRVVVQSAGQAYQLNGAILKQEFARHAELENLFLLYIQALGYNSLFARDVGMARSEDMTGQDDFHMSWHASFFHKIKKAAKLNSRFKATMQVNYKQFAIRINACISFGYKANMLVHLKCAQSDQGECVMDIL